MHQLVKLALAGTLLLGASSCSTFLDINDNPNSPLVATPNTILAQALAGTASNYSTGFNAYGSFTAGYWGRSGTVNGYAIERTYNYTTNAYSNLWNNTYNNLEDYQIIQNQATGYGRHAAIARIMKVYNFLLLVDEYGDIPYTNALGGLSKSLTPTYDKAQTVYADLLVQLTGAIADINTAVADQTQANVTSEDIVFQGNMTSWKRFANNLKLRILMRESQTSDAALTASVRTQLAALQTATDGFLTADVLAQPGYLQTAGKQNPFYDVYGVTPAGTSFTATYSYQLPTRYLLEQYVGNKDPRAVKLYATAPSATSAIAAYSLNYFGTTITGNSFPYIGADLGEPTPLTGNRSSRFLNGGGILKGFDAPTPLMLAAEYYFLRSEAETRGLFTGGDATAKTDFNAGITASFVYFYTPAASRRGTASDSSAFVTTGLYTPTATDLAAVAAGTMTQAQLNTKVRINSGKVARYMQVANPTNPLVNYDLATSNGTLGKQNVIIYQKYLAMNTVGSIEAWDDYRRTAQPKFRASYESQSTRADHLPVRLLYPQSEVSTNAANIPAGINQFTSKIFWDVVD